MKKIIIPIGVLLMMGTLHAQQNNKIIPSVIAPNIDANALGVFDKQSVNLSTGTPNIEVLFHTIRVGDLELPIKLQYDASGIKVGQMATSVGLGWSINNSGILTQEVRDKIDGQSTNIIQQYVNTPTIDGRNAILYNYEHLNQPYTGTDLETDIYTINYFGNTIPFFYNYNDNSYIPQQKDNTRIVKGANKWTVSLGDGTEFNFNNMYSRKSVNSITIPKSSNASPGSSVTSPELNDSWYLTDIASRGQSAKLEYVSSSNRYYSKGTENYKVVSILKNVESVKMISSITTPYEKVVFEYSPEREDMNGDNGKADLLKFIKVYDNNGKLVKQFQLVYDYYNETEPLPNYAATSVVENYKSKRLRLREVKRLDIQSGNYENHYGFTYNSDILPNRFSPKQDLWGYYNGKPNIEYMFLGDSSWGGGGTPANLNVDPTYSGLGQISTVTYPTGGYSQYTFESNESEKPANYDQMIPEAEEFTPRAVNIARMPVHYKGHGKFEVPFTVDSEIIGNVLDAQVRITNCPGPYYATTCPYKVMIDGMWINPGISKDLVASSFNLGVGPHKLQASSSVMEDFDDMEFPYHFSAGIQWKQRKTAAEMRETPIFIGGRRVQQIVTNAGNQFHTQKFVYRLEDGKTTSGSIITVPYVAMKDGSGKVIFSVGTNPLSKLRGQNLVYRRVEKLEYGSGSGLSNGKTVQYFNKPIGGLSFNRYPFPPPDDRSHMSGQLTREEHFKYDYISDEFKKIEDVNYLYSYPDKCMNEIPTNDCITRLKGLSYSEIVGIINTNATIYDDIDWGLYSLEASPYKLLSKTSTQYLDNGALVTREELDYTSSIHNNLTKSVTTFPDKTIQETGYQYAHEQNNTDMIAANMIGIPLQTEVKENGKVISKVRSIYGKNAQTSNLVLPVSEQKFDSDNTASAQNIVSYDQYDANGNILQYTTKGSVPTAIIWGYKNTQPIARIEGATYQEAAALAADIIAKSNEDVDMDKEKALMNALDTYRNQSAFKSHSITTYTYDPQVGVTSITPPTGVREFYKYDSMNRLQSVVDANNNILKEFNYNYKH
ncbi:hypothetical protein [Chryseobacterium sp.]|uniref:hypothetical protein n=1 Tax=Chryseobacterium sp. TaxID=1871047 RepID=UPI0024E27635|nr:hypothetical protein [Chryseobacterium sp.]